MIEIGWPAFALICFVAGFGVGGLIVSFVRWASSA